MWMVASASWGSCSRNEAATKARGVAHRNHRRRIKPTDLLQDTASRQQLQLST